MNSHAAHPISPPPASVDVYNRQPAALQAQAFQAPQVLHPSYGQSQSQPHTHPFTHYHTHHHLYAPTPQPFADTDPAMGGARGAGCGGAGGPGGMPGSGSHWVTPYPPQRSPYNNYNNWRHPSYGQRREFYHNNNNNNNSIDGGNYFYDSPQTSHSAFSLAAGARRNGHAPYGSAHAPVHAELALHSAPSYTYRCPPSATVTQSSVDNGASATSAGRGCEARSGGGGSTTTGGYIYENPSSHSLPAYTHNTHSAHGAHGGVYNGNYGGHYGGAYGRGYPAQHSHNMHTPDTRYYPHMSRYHPYPQQQHYNPAELSAAPIEPRYPPAEAHVPWLRAPPAPADMGGYWDGAYMSRMNMPYVMNDRAAELQQQQAHMQQHQQPPPQPQRVHHLFQYNGHITFNPDARSSREPLLCAAQPAAATPIAERPVVEADADAAAAERAKSTVVDAPTTSPPLISATGTDSGISNCSMRMCGESVSQLSVDFTASISGSPHAPQNESTSDDEVSDILLNSEEDNCNDVDRDDERRDDSEDEDNDKSSERRSSSDVAPEMPKNEETVPEDIAKEPVISRDPRISAKAISTDSSEARENTPIAESYQLDVQEAPLSLVSPSQPLNASIMKRQARKREQKSPPLRTVTFLNDNGLAGYNNRDNEPGPSGGASAARRMRMTLHEMEEGGENRPLPGFQQTFGSTEIGRFSGTFPHVPNAALNVFWQNERQSPTAPDAGQNSQPHDSESTESHDVDEDGEGQSNNTANPSAKPFATLGDLVEFERRQGRSYLKVQK